MKRSHSLLSDAWRWRARALRRLPWGSRLLRLEFLHSRAQAGKLCFIRCSLLGGLLSFGEKRTGRGLTLLLKRLLLKLQGFPQLLSFVSTLLLLLLERRVELVGLRRGSLKFMLLAGDDVMEGLHLQLCFCRRLLCLLCFAPFICSHGVGLSGNAVEDPLLLCDSGALLLEAHGRLLLQFVLLLAHFGGHMHNVGLRPKHIPD